MLLGLIAVALVGTRFGTVEQASMSSTRRPPDAEPDGQHHRHVSYDPTYAARRRHGAREHGCAWADGDQMTVGDALLLVDRSLGIQVDVRRNPAASP